MAEHAGFHLDFFSLGGQSALETDWPSVMALPVAVDLTAYELYNNRARRCRIRYNI